MQPRHSRETVIPVLPSVVYFIPPISVRNGIGGGVSPILEHYMNTAKLVPILLLVLCLSSCATQTVAEARTGTVTTSDGTRLSGGVTDLSANEIQIAGSDGSSHTVKKSQVRSIEYADAVPMPPPAGPAVPGPRSAPAAAKPVRVHEEHYHPTPAVISTSTYTVPVDTELSVRSEETIDSETAVEGQTFAAEVTQDVLDEEGSVVIPDGSNAQIVIKSASKGSRFRGASDLVLDLQSVSVGGKRYMISAVDIEKKGRESVGVNKRTAIFTGAGAAIGAVVGAISGGKKGAAIGAASGAGAGAIAQVITSGNSIKVPVETVLTFRLDKPLKVIAK